MCPGGNGEVLYYAAFLGPKRIFAFKAPPLNTSCTLTASKSGYTLGGPDPDEP